MAVIAAVLNVVSHLAGLSARSSLALNHSFTAASQRSLLKELSPGQSECEYGERLMLASRIVLAASAYRPMSKYNLAKA